MNSDSIGDRFKEMQIDKCDNKETIEEVPKILSPDVNGVFHIFANMLDVKSFMKLAMTSKEMYKRCMEDKEIKINVDVYSLTVLNRNGSVEFDFSFPNISHRHHDGFVAVLRKLPCKIKLRKLEIRDKFKPGASMESKVHKYMKEIGVNNIHELQLYRDVTEWETIFAIVKDFDVKTVSIIHCEIKEDILRSLLQLNLDKLSYNNDEVDVDFILEIDSPTREVCFPDVDMVSKQELLNIISKIQSGSLHRLILHAVAVDWDEFHALPFDHEGSLPDDRPLIFERLTDDDDEHIYYDPDDYGFDSVTVGLSEYWFLHEDGAVTKCVVDDNLEIFKCDPREYPWILRKEEDILKELAEKRQRTFCSANHFHKFCASFNMIDSSHQGPLPENRPLYFKASENSFWFLGGDESLMQCSWENGCATWEPYHHRILTTFEHPALAKYMFWNVLRESGGRDGFMFSCEGVEEFDSWFVSVSQLPFDYSGPLPSERPLVFEKAPSELRPELGSKLRVVLLDDRLLECEFISCIVKIKICHYSNRPPGLFSAKTVVEMLKNPQQGNVDVNLPSEEFLDGLNQFKQSPLVLEKRLLISEWITDKFWYFSDSEAVWKVEWEKGRVSFSKNELRGSPPCFMKQVFRNLAEAGNRRISLKMELEEFNSCLEQFTVLPFEYSGPLTSDSPMAFVKNEIRHTCDEEAKCQCSEIIFVWFLWERTRLTKCSLGEENEPKKVIFGDYLIDIPPALKTKEYLKILLQAKYDKSSRLEWFGSVKDCRACLKGYRKLPFDYKGPLPEERPLLFENNKYPYDQFLLRADGAIIKVPLREFSVFLCLQVNDDEYLPPALKSML